MDKQNNNSKSEKQEQLSLMRHSCSHILAQAVLHLYDNVKLAIGPAIEDGFYYDFEFGEDVDLSKKDLKNIEEEMKKIVKAGEEFKQSFKSIEEAKQYFEDKEQPYKLDLIEALEEKGEKELSFYKSGDFVDLCAGPHVENAKDIGAFKLHSLAGAYWKGDENEKMLSRIYGYAFESEAQLEEYVKNREKAKKRDHKLIGKQMELFHFDETAPGMPYWLPGGQAMLIELLDFWRQEHRNRGYEEISSPLLNKKELFEQSGHWDHYHESMFVMDEEKQGVYGVKPMNCPNAVKVYKLKKRSYRDLPLRFSDCDRLHRNEQSGELNGLLRVQSFIQDDSHNFIEEEKIGEEYEEIFEICDKFYEIFGLDYEFRLGKRPDNFMGDVAVWNKAEAVLEEILAKSGKKYHIKEKDGAFYGPKVDILMNDALGRQWQMGTIQLDFQLPQRFDISYVGRDGEEKIPVIVHRVIYGSLERFMGILIEHTGGKFPLWIAPEQVRVLSVSEKYNDYAKEIGNKLKKAGDEYNLWVRSQVDGGDSSLESKIRAGEVMKIPYILVVGGREQKNKSVSVRIRGKGDIGEVDFTEFRKKMIDEIRSKKLGLWK